MSKSDLSRLQGVPTHIETLHRPRGDKRRHKSRCIHYRTSNQCDLFCERCRGSAHCPRYKEKVITEEPEKKTASQADTPAVPKINWSRRFPVGSHVRHTSFGDGTVVEIGDRNIIKVKFTGGGVKSINAKECVDKGMLKWK